MLGKANGKTIFVNVAPGNVTEQAMREWLRRLLDEDGFVGPAAG